MKNLSRLVMLAVVLLIVGGAVFLATWDIPAPVSTVEKVIPDDQFPR